VVEPTSRRKTTSQPALRTNSLSDLYDAIDAVGRPHLTAAELSRKTDLTTERAREELERLADLDEVARQDVTSADAVWYPTDLDAVTDRERVVLFPDRREVVVQHADQFTRAQLSQFAHLVDTNRSGGAIYGARGGHLAGAVRLPERPHSDDAGRLRRALAPPGGG